MKKSLLCRNDESSKANLLANAESSLEKIRRRTQRISAQNVDKTTHQRMLKTSKVIELSIIGMIRMMTKMFKTTWRRSDQLKKAP